MRLGDLNVTLLLLMLCSAAEVYSSIMSLKNNGYSNFLVAIHPSIEENFTLVTELKAILSSLSNTMYKNTRKRAFLEEVKILLPETWSDNAAYEPAEREWFKDADIRVDQPCPLHRDMVYTKHPDGCGYTGKYIHLTREFIASARKKRQVWGKPSRILMNAFVTYRYGAFDEYGTEELENMFYLDENNTIMLTACPKIFPGDRLRNVDLKPCAINQHTGLPKNCFYFPTPRVAFSNMFVPSANLLPTFCENNASVQQFQHNKDAPTLHNRMCHGQGVWNVILKSTDFRNFYARERFVNFPKEFMDTRPKIRLMYPRLSRDGSGKKFRGKRVVFVMDISSAAKEFDRMFRLRQLLSKLIRYVLPEGVDFGLISFTSEPTQVQGMTRLLSDDIRNEVLDRVQNTPSNSSQRAAGRAVLKAIKVLRKDNGATESAILLLSSFQAANQPPYLHELLHKVTRAGIKAYTIGIATKPDPHLAQLAMATGGKYSVYPESDGASLSLDGILLHLLTDLYDNDTPVELIRTAFSIKSAHQVTTKTVYVDSTVGANTSLLFSHCNHLNLEVVVSGPSATYQTRDFETSRKFGTMFLRIPLAEQGLWNVTIRATVRQKSEVVLAVWSFPRPGTTAISVTSWLSRTMVGRSRQVVVYADVLQGYLPVVVASVIAKVKVTSAYTVIVNLYDNGQGCDTRKSDGCYCVEFKMFQESGGYTFEVSVESIRGSTSFIVTRGSKHSLNFNYLHFPPISKVATPKFKRTGWVSSLCFVDYQTENMVPPKAVSDFRLVAYDLKERSLTFNWTAPGDDMNYGIARRYEIRRSENVSVLQTSFRDAILLVGSDIIAGNTTPKAAGSPQRLVVRMPVCRADADVGFALMSIDHSNNPSDVSNIVVVRCLGAGPRRGTHKTTTVVFPDVAEATPGNPRIPQQGNSTRALGNETKLPAKKIFDPNSNKSLKHPPPQKEVKSSLSGISREDIVECLIVGIPVLVAIFSVILFLFYIIIVSFVSGHQTTYTNPHS